MAKTKWTDEMLERAKNLADRKLSEIANVLNVEFNTKLSAKAVKRKFENEGIKRGQLAKSIIQNKTRSLSEKVIEVQEGTEMTDEFILKAHGLEPNMFELVDGIHSFYQQNSNQDGLVNLFQSKIKYKVKAKRFDERLFTDKIEPVVIDRKQTGKRNLVIPLSDWHFGITKLEDVKGKLADVVEIISKGYQTIVIEQLGDLFHSNLMKKSQTMSGTVLDDVDMEQAVKDARQFFDALLTECIANSEQVVIEHAEGNHSGSVEYMFLIYLEAKYPQVKVNYHNKHRHAYLLDNVAIFITHGQYAKRKDLPMLFATEYAELWSKANAREIHTGHFHTQLTLDYSGVVHRQLGTIKQNDNYEIENGWTMNKKAWQLFEYDSDRLRVTYDL